MNEMNGKKSVYVGVPGLDTAGKPSAPFLPLLPFLPLPLPPLGPVPFLCYYNIRQERGLEARTSGLGRGLESDLVQVRCKLFHVLCIMQGLVK